MNPAIEPRSLSPAGFFAGGGEVGDGVGFALGAGGAMDIAGGGFGVVAIGLGPVSVVAAVVGATGAGDVGGCRRIAAAGEYLGNGVAAGSLDLATCGAGAVADCRIDDAAGVVGFATAVGAGATVGFGAG